MLRRKFTILMMTTALALSPCSVYASEEGAAQETITEEGVIDFDEGTAEAESDTEQNGSGENGDNGNALQVEIPKAATFSVGYFFEDGSFDKWDEFAGFSIGDCYLSDNIYGNIEQDGEFYQSIKENRSSLYSDFGIDMENFESVRPNIGYAIQSESGTTRYSKADGMDTAFLVLSDGNYQKGFQIGIDEVEEKQGLILATSEGTFPVTVKEKYANDGKDFFSVNGNLENMKCGVPVVFEDGSVAGIITNVGADSATVLADTSIAKILDDANLSYDVKALNASSGDVEILPDDTSTASDESYPGDTLTSDDAIMDDETSSLANNLLTKTLRAESIDTSIYTEESVAALEKALQESNDLINSTDATSEDYTNAINNLDAAVANLEEKPEEFNFGKIFPFIAIGVGVFAILFVLTIFYIGHKNKQKYIIEDDDEEDEADVKKSKREEAKARKAEKAAEKAAEKERKKNSRKKGLKGKGKDDDEYDIDKPISKKINEKRSSVNKKRPKPEYDADLDEEIADVSTSPNNHKKDMDDDYDDDGRFDDDDDGRFDDDDEQDTSVLSDEEAETSILNDKIPTAYLLRKSDNKKIPITKANFVIGKSQNKTDYRIVGNTTISRHHAVISYKDNTFIIEDTDSKNGTFVNGAKIEPGHAVSITNEDDITFSDVDFTFIRPEED